MNPYPTLRRAIPLIVVAALLLAACGNTDQPAGNALVLRWTYSTSLTDWASASAADFNSQNFKTDSGRPIWIEASAVDAGQAVTDMVGGGELPVLWTPADPSWIAVLHQQAGNTVFLENCISVAESPLVIAMWEPVARALGWPGRTLGWLDVASLAADPSAWAYYSGGPWSATLRTGHAHPGLSDAAAPPGPGPRGEATDAVTAEDVQNAVVARRRVRSAVCGSRRPPPAEHCHARP
jgi:Ca-activated chloride channel family protein